MSNQESQPVGTIIDLTDSKKFKVSLTPDGADTVITAFCEHLTVSISTQNLPKGIYIE